MNQTRERRLSLNSDFVQVGQELRQIADDIKRKSSSSSLESSSSYTDLTRCALINNFLHSAGSSFSALKPRSLSAASSFTDLLKSRQN